MQKIKNILKKLLKYFGPGFITGSADNDPSGIGTYSIAGAQYGLLMAWLMPFQLPLMFAIQEMCARIGSATGAGLAANMKRVFSKPFLLIAVSLLAFANIINIGANISIMASCLQLLLGESISINLNIIAIFITITIILMQVFISYNVYSKILLFLTIFLFSYVITAFMVTQNWVDILKFTFVPHIKFNKDFILVMAGVIGTTISPYLFFWQSSHEIEENSNNGDTGKSKKLIKKLIKKMRLDTFIGMFFSQLIALFIVITCFETLHRNGITQINTAYDAAVVLKPLAGQWAFLLFTAGIIGAGFLGIPVLAGSCAYALSEVFNFKQSLAYKFKEAKFFYGVIAASTLIGLAINFIGINPMKALLYAAIINCITAVPIIAFIIILANKKEIMGENKNGILSNTIGWFTFAIMLIISLLIIFL
ncbi:MAG: Natural resistance-associated macrophage protein [candidate division TM6 bacterium GW2011_GWF2_30_66]|nr:MAG: Natural resistance-associated macrophage protein [candidate division TM6 bacterium GW2011_GWF2_30_66]